MGGKIFGPETILALLAGLFILVAKLQFVRRVLAAKSDVNLFNYTLALCLLASGERKQCFLNVSKHRKNCECCHHHSLFKGHNVNVNIVVPNCQKCNQCLKCQVSGHKSRGLLFDGVL